MTMSLVVPDASFAANGLMSQLPRRIMHLQSWPFTLHASGFTLHGRRLTEYR